MKVLVVDDDGGARSYLRAAVEREGHIPLTATNGAEGLEIFENEEPDLVVTDIRMPIMDGLQMLARIRDRDKDTDVIVMTGYGSEDYAVQALRLRASNYIHKPIRHSEFAHLLDKYESRLADRRIDESIPSLVVERSFRIRVENEVRLVMRVSDYLVREVAHVLDDENRLCVRLGLVELLMNALEHGNLEITSGEKNAAIEAGGGALEALYRDRRSNPEFAKRVIIVDFSQNQERLQWVITDQGLGFDWGNIPSPVGNEAVLSSHGRGIFLSRFQFDELEYAGPGNQVRAMKRIPSS